MNGNIHGRDQELVIAQPSQKHLVFSLEYVVSNKKYGIKGFGEKDKKVSNDRYCAFVQKLCDLSRIDLPEAISRGKQNGGCETFPWKQLDQRLHDSLKNIKIISQDTSLWVFRFNKQKDRMICKSDAKEKNLLYILAFDFDFSAYDHG